MTWDVNDVGKGDENTPEDETSAAEKDESTPTVALFAHMQLFPESPLKSETSTPTLIRRDLLYSGMCDDRTWNRIKRLMTRGIFAQ